MSANARYPQDAIDIAKRHAPQGADMSDLPGESDIDMAIRLRQSPAWIKELDARQIVAESIADELLAARADGARQERRGSQKVMIGMAVIATVAVLSFIILAFVHWGLR